jgi:hypothetical protein
MAKVKRLLGLRSDSALGARAGDSPFAAEVKRFARARGFTSGAKLADELGYPDQSTIFKHLRPGRRGPQRETVSAYARLLRVPETYLLAISDFVDDDMVADAQKTFDNVWTDATAKTLLVPSRADELWERIRPRWAAVSATVYVEVQRDLAEVACGLRVQVRPALAILRAALSPLGIAVDVYVKRPDPDTLVNAKIMLGGLLPENFAELAVTFIRGLYHQCEIDTARQDRELAAYCEDPVAWICSRP